MIERSINFERPRRLRCRSCRHKWLVTAEWLDRFNQALVACPVCNTDCRGEDRPDFCADPEDPVHNDSAVRGFHWYHSSTHENWPDSNFDPAARLTADTNRRMEAMGSGVGAVERWAERQKAKALHVGTYEAAIENMFRRMETKVVLLTSSTSTAFNSTPTASSSQECTRSPRIGSATPTWPKCALPGRACSAM
ncbi:MAG TPA: hypothetical protein VFJ97_13920 [Dermatophilaceae bacterium]|nr:hypothetical protein [Dermatophilaceae bacterium]